MTEFNGDVSQKTVAAPIARAAADKFDISPNFKNRFV
jgi:hypothetical protein